MAKCERCGKKPMSGNNVPHSLQKTKRKWRPNIQKVLVTDEQGVTRRRYLCANCIKTLSKTKAL
jgi:large subunit ribosomal protein L28